MITLKNEWISSVESIPPKYRAIRYVVFACQAAELVRQIFTIYKNGSGRSFGFQFYIRILDNSSFARLLLYAFGKKAATFWLLAVVTEVLLLMDRCDEESSLGA